jgi:predicted ATPase
MTQEIVSIVLKSKVEAIKMRVNGIRLLVGDRQDVPERLDFSSSPPGYFGNMNLTVIVGENGVGKTRLLRRLAAGLTNPRPHSLDGQVLQPDPEQVLAPWDYPIVVDHDLGDKAIPTYLSSYFVVSEKIRNPRLKNSNPSAVLTTGGFRDAMINILNELRRPNSAPMVHSLHTILKFVGYKPPSILEIKLRKRSHLVSQDEIEMRLSRSYFVAKHTRVPLDWARPVLRQLLTKLEDNASDDALRLDMQDCFSAWEGIPNYGLSKVLNIMGLDVVPVCEKTSSAGVVPQLLPISKMSSGELSIFMRMFELTRWVDDNRVILLDEPESHLHPMWVTGYVRLLYDLFQQYKVHILVASHSPFIASDVPADCIMGLKRTDSGSIGVYTVRYPTLGSSVPDILSDVFHVSTNQIDRYLDARIEYIRNLIVASRFDDAMDALYDIADPTLRMTLADEIQIALKGAQK